MGERISRRKFVGGLGIAGAAGVGATLAGKSTFWETSSSSASPGGAVAFYGDHQAGIATPAQDRLLFGAFDVLDATRGDLVGLLHDWTEASARFAAGNEIGRNDVLAAPPDDTGEALGLQPAQLTMTFGFGPTLFEKNGHDRFGIAAKRPNALIDLPAFPRDNLDPDKSGGDLCIQVCADDPTVCFHALRNLTRIGKGVVGLRWTQLGFGRTSSTSSSQDTPRNLLGFKDGTNNVKGDDGALMSSQVWVGPNEKPAWMRGGSYLVARRISMRIEQWDRDFLEDQEHVIGRVKSTGAPIGSKQEHDAVDLHARSADGNFVIPDTAHIRLAAPSTNRGHHILRRGYSFTDGVNPVTAGLDAGLFFLAYMRDPRTQFVPLQHKLALEDALNEYIEHNGSAIFAVPPGVQRGHDIGETLFSA
ncbi:MAG TPA: iron uptake transporter deferrochelatase/peroxidase subunit [Acidimicrobiia bacterium]|nr:iron uptake transporter deferrochelatase/peroxidase subunit [Acidimicrobiia bacterium]